MLLKTKITIIAGVGVLAIAVGLIIYGETRPLKRTFYGSVRDLLPTQEQLPPGWTMEYQPIADTPEMKAKVGELLNYDDAVFAVYTNGDLRISAYIAYWTPGKMSDRLVAGHSPDVCWVGVGWKCTERRVNNTLTLADGTPLLPAEERVMEFAGKPESILFWHLVDGQVRLSGNTAHPPWYAPLVEMWHRGFQQRGEQFFVRLSSNEQSSEWWNIYIASLISARLPVALR